MHSPWRRRLPLRPTVWGEVRHKRSLLVACLRGGDRLRLLSVHLGFDASCSLGNRIELLASGVEGSPSRRSLSGDLDRHGGFDADCLRSRDALGTSPAGGGRRAPSGRGKAVPERGLPGMKERSMRGLERRRQARWRQLGLRNAKEHAPGKKKPAQGGSR